MNTRFPICVVLTLALLGILLLPTASIQAQQPGFTKTFDDPSLPCLGSVAPLALIGLIWLRRCER